MSKVVRRLSEMGFMRKVDSSDVLTCSAANAAMRSGKNCSVIRRTACHPRLRNAVIHWARVAVMHDPIAKQRYADLRALGQPHGQALRSVADRLLAVVCAMLEGRTPYRTPQVQTSA